MRTVLSEFFIRELLPGLGYRRIRHPRRTIGDYAKRPRRFGLIFAHVKALHANADFDCAVRQRGAAHYDAGNTHSAVTGNVLFDPLTKVLDGDAADHR